MFRWFRFPKNYYPIFFILLLVGISVLFSNGITPKSKFSTSSPHPVTVKDQPSYEKKSNLQLNKPLIATAITHPPYPTLSVTPTPPPPGGPFCGIHKPKRDNCTCTDSPTDELIVYCENIPGCTPTGGGLIIQDANGQNPKLDVCEFYQTAFYKSPQFDEKRADTANCETWCYAKPVIYLYPTEPMFVDVSVTVPGEIIVSDPLYPEGGWKNVEAHPDGTLYYQGKKYKELFYESNVDDTRIPTRGLILKTTELREKLSIILTQLGLIKHERAEFIDFWIPRLEDLHTQYIFFSVIDPDEKQRIDHVTITPKPDTMIEFLAYFKGINMPLAPEPLILPKNPPQRIGFTAVEWGGTIDHKATDKL